MRVQNSGCVNIWLSKTQSQSLSRLIFSSLNKMWTSGEQVLKRRAAVGGWKMRNRERYLQQKRELSSRPEYKARRRELYHEKREALIAAGFQPKKKGRPRLYTVEEAAERKRQWAREHAKRIRSANNEQMSQTKRKCH